MFLLGKLKMYAALIGAALVAVVTVYYRGRADGRDELEYEIKDDRLEKILKAKDVQDDVQALDDDVLLRRSSKWVRNDNG
jgi:hypothetical protein